MAGSSASEQAVRNAADGLPVRPSNVRRPGQSAFSVTIGSCAPVQKVAAAAQATSRIRLGTLVLNVPFRNPALLASARDPRHNRRAGVAGPEVITARHRDIALLVVGCHFMEMLDETNAIDP